MEIALFPLHAVLAPGLVLPIHVFEERYRELVRRCLASGESFGVVLIRDGSEVGDPLPSVAEVGTSARIRVARRYGDGRFHLGVLGDTRFRIERINRERAPYLVAEATAAEEDVGDPVVARRLAGRVALRYLTYLEQLRSVQTAADTRRDEERSGITEESGEADEGRAVLDVARRIASPDDPVVLSHVLSGLVHIDLDERQALLEASTAESRLARLDTILGREIALLEQGLAPYVVDPGSALLGPN